MDEKDLVRLETRFDNLDEQLRCLSRSVELINDRLSAFTEWKARIEERLRTGTEKFGAIERRVTEMDCRLDELFVTRHGNTVRSESENKGRQESRERLRTVALAITAVMSALGVILNLMR